MRFRFIVVASWILLGLWYATNIAPDRVACAGAAMTENEILQSIN